MAVIKYKNGTKAKIPPAKNAEDELLNSIVANKVLNRDVDCVFIKRTVHTKTQKERQELKELCTKLKIELEPLDRNFTKHRVYICEENIVDAFGKWMAISNRRKDEYV